MRRRRCEEEDAWKKTLLSSVCEYSYVCIHMYMYNYIYASGWGAGGMRRRTLVLSANLRRAHSGTARVWMYTCMCTHVCKYIYMHQYERGRYGEGNACFQRQLLTHLELNCGCMNIHVYVNSVYICISSIRWYVDISVYVYICIHYVYTYI